MLKIYQTVNHNICSSPMAAFFMSWFAWTLETETETNNTPENKRRKTSPPSLKCHRCERYFYSEVNLNRHFFCIVSTDPGSIRGHLKSK